MTAPYVRSPQYRQVRGSGRCARLPVKPANRNELYTPGRISGNASGKKSVPASGRFMMIRSNCHGRILLRRRASARTGRILPALFFRIFSINRRTARGLRSAATMNAARDARAIANGPTPVNISSTHSLFPVFSAMRWRSVESRAEK